MANMVGSIGLGILGATLYKKFRGKMPSPSLPLFTPTIPPATLTTTVPPTPPPTISLPTPTIVPSPTLRSVSPYVPPPPPPLPPNFSYRHTRLSITSIDKMFPYLVILCLDCGTGIQSTSLGFVAFSEPSITTIWGSSKFLMSQGKYLSKGKVSVYFMGGEESGIYYEAQLVYVDYTYDLAVVNVRDINSTYVKVARLAPLNGLMLHCLDYVPLLKEYMLTTCPLSGALEGSNACKPFQHCLWRVQPLTGICLNAQLEIVGLKIRMCNKNSDLFHLLPVVIIIDKLAANSFRYHDLRHHDFRIQDQETRILNEFIMFHPECCQQKAFKTEVEAYGDSWYESEEESSGFLGSLFAESDKSNEALEILRLVAMIRKEKRKTYAARRKLVVMIGKEQIKTYAARRKLRRMIEYYKLDKALCLDKKKKVKALYLENRIEKKRRL